MRNDYTLAVIMFIGFTVLGVQTFLIARMLWQITALIERTHP